MWPSVIVYIMLCGVYIGYAMFTLVGVVFTLGDMVFTLGDMVFTLGNAVVTLYTR